MILVFTGNAGPDIAVAAAATALHAAEHGHETLLLSLTPAHSLGALLGTPLGEGPTPIAPHLAALALDIPSELAAAWKRGRTGMPDQLARLGDDELPLLPGLEAFFGLLRLRDLTAHYGCIIIDAGAHDHLLRTLALPDGLRWGVRLLFGLDRGPGRSTASIGRAVLPTSFIPSDTINRVQDVRVAAEHLRTLLTDSSKASVRFVLRPDAPALEEARLAIAALQLHGLTVPALIAGPLLPTGVGAGLSALSERQHALLDEAATLWPTRTMLHFELNAETPGLAMVHATARHIYLHHRDIVFSLAEPPIADQVDGKPALSFDLPALPKGALHLTLSGDELIIQIGPYRRHILLPENLRGSSSIKATRQGDRLIVRTR